MSSVLAKIIAFFVLVIATAKTTLGDEALMKLEPDGDRPFVIVTHRQLPHCAWKLRLPEYAYFTERDGKRRGVIASDVVWERSDDGRTLRFRWNAPLDVKREAGVDFSGVVTAGDIEVAFEVSMTNLSDEAWKGRSSLFCLMCGEAPLFHDYDARRTYVYRAGRFITVNEMVGGEFAPHRMCGFPAVGPAEVDESGKKVSGFMAKVSSDGEWVLGIATDIARSVSCNFKLRTSCIHSNPNWGEVAPNETVTARGKFYLFRGTLQELLEKIKSEFSR